MAEHDQRFKTLVRAFFRELLALFFPTWAAALDCNRLEWLDKELLPDPPAGKSFYADLVARVGTRDLAPALRPEEQPSDTCLVHLEIEAEDRAANARGHAYDYHKHLRDRYRVPVLSGVLYLRVGLEGLGDDVYEEMFLGRSQIRFEFPYVGFSALDAEPYVAGPNLLGVALAALMRIAPERRGWLAAEAMRRIADSAESQWRKYLLGECVQAYLPLDEEQRKAFEQMLRGEPYQGAKQMVQTWFEEVAAKAEQTGLEKGEATGRVLERREFLKGLLEAKFGPLPPGASQRLKEWPAERLREVGVALLKAQSLDELGLGENPGSDRDGANVV